MTRSGDLKLPGDVKRIVPPTGLTAELTVFVSAAMAFLAVFAMAALFTTGRVVDAWSDELARTASIRISAPAQQMAAQTGATLTILGQTPGIVAARALDDAEQARLLAPWLGADVDLSDLPVPRLIEIEATDEGFDAEGLRLRLRAEVPGAVLDDHIRWRQPVLDTAARLRSVGWIGIGLICMSFAAMITLAASASLASNAKVIAVLRLIGARDTFVARAFTRRFALRGALGASAGMLLGMGAVALVPSAGSGLLGAGLGFRGAEWLTPLALPFLSGFVAFWAARAAAFRTLRETR